MSYRKISNDIAIDLGTSFTRIYQKGEEKIFEEPTVIAYDTVNRVAIAAGWDAYKMLGKTPHNISVVSPVSAGVIANNIPTEEMLKIFLDKICPKTLLKPRVMVSIPCSMTEVERRAVRDSMFMIGARRVYLMKSPIAAAYGANCDIMPERGLMIANLGGGSANIATLSSGQAVVEKLYKVSGDKFTHAICDYLKNQKRFLIGFAEAEKCKIEAGCLFPHEKNTTVKICGMDLDSRLPREITVSSGELMDMMMPVYNELCNDIKEAVSEIPSNLLGDVLEDGILLTGGVANTIGLVQRLKMDTEMKIFTAKESEKCTIKGLSTAMENIDKIPACAFEEYIN